MIRKKEGFQGQRAIALPKSVLHSQCAANKVIDALYLTDIGYYPNAKYHYRQRPNGADQHILIYCYEGCGTVMADSTEYKVKAGEFIIIPRKTKHVYTADAQNPWTIYWLHFVGVSANNIVTFFNKKNGYKAYAGAPEKIVTLFNEIYRQLERGYGTETLMYANMCLWHFLSCFIFNYSIIPADNEKIKDACDAAIDFLQVNVEKMLSLQAIAASVHLSPSHFSFIFKKKTGFSPIEYFNHLKIQKACQYLLFTNLLVKEIALVLGIEDQYYFSRMFSKIMGISPNDYRQRSIERINTGVT